MTTIFSFLVRPILLSRIQKIDNVLAKNHIFACFKHCFEYKMMKLVILLFFICGCFN